VGDASSRRRSVGAAVQQAELVSLWVGEDDPGLITLADVDSPSPEGEEPLDLDRLIDAKLATREFSLQEILQVASAEIGLANAILAAAKEAGTEPDRRRLNVPLLMEAQEVMKVDSWLAINPEAALWYRGLATVTDDPAGGPFAALLQGYGAKRFVTGHTPQQSRSITMRFGGRAILIDTGMLSSVYKGRASALEIDGDKLTAHYEDGKVSLP
jgi:hypothetical protein